MALPTITLNNETASDINLTQLAVLVPASGSVTVSDFNLTDEILNDEELQGHIDANEISVTYEGDPLTVEQTKAKILPQQALDILHNFSAIVDPVITDDANAGYSPGSLWLNRISNRSFRCLNDAPGAAAWRSESGNSPVLAWGNRSVSGTSTPRFMDPWGDFGDIAGTDGTTNARIVAPRDGTLSDLFVRHGNPDGNGNDIVYTIRVNGVVSVLAVTIASTGSQVSNAIDTVAVLEGQNIDIIVTKAAGIGNSPDGVTVQALFN